VLDEPYGHLLAFAGDILNYVVPVRERRVVFLDGREERVFVEASG
jgi:hypothetical protein